MAQRDYVGHRKFLGVRRKKTKGKKKYLFSGILKTMITLMVAGLIAFISGLYFIAHNRLEEAVIVPPCGKHTGIGLPPKPEERWRYIKELENRQIGVERTNDPSLFD
ncbi:MAG: cell division protein FtsN [Sodalis sp. Fse]|nr:MAG: cell division protein FtsN [Sodalis sp. Fse]